MLQIYIAKDCPGSERTQAILELVRRADPALNYEIIDVGAPGAAVPEQVIGTPIYLWHNQIAFFGNPSVQELLDYMRNNNEYRIAP